MWRPVAAESLVTVNVVPSLLFLYNLMMEAVRFSKRRFLQEPHDVTCQKTAFLVTVAKTSNLTKH
jgi:hypothetical protein